VRRGYRSSLGRFWREEDKQGKLPGVRDALLKPGHDRYIFNRTGSESLRPHGIEGLSSILIRGKGQIWQSTDGIRRSAPPVYSDDALIKA
jgi:hypothetical protein